jgi:hypothetical protein
MYGIGFYDLEDRASLDPFLTRVESDVGPILRKIRAERSVDSLSATEQKSLALFVALQYLRTPSIRVLLEKLRDGAAVLPDGTPIPESHEWFKSEYPVLSVNEVQSLWFATWAFDLARSLFSKVWMVLQAPSNCALVISDHPVVQRSTLVSSNGAEIWKQATLYLPIAPYLILCFGARETFPAAETTKCAGVSGNLWTGYAHIDAKEVRVLNWCQVQRAVRWIVCSSSDFVPERAAS